MRPIVLIASSIEHARKRLRRALQEEFAVHEVTRRADLARSMGTLKPDVLVLDVDLPRPGHFTSMRALQQLNPVTAIVLLSSAPNEKEGISALRAGARGYGKKDMPPSLLKKAVERVREGEIWAGRKIVSKVLDELTSVIAHGRKDSSVESGIRFNRLSSRQREIALLVAGGARNKEIAKQLKVTERAVKAHLTTIFRKLGLSHRLQLALFITEHARLSQ